jgi:NACHT domain
MPTSIVDQVVDFYYALFDRIFSEPFGPRIADRLKRDAVLRQIQDSGGAASQSLTRFFLNVQLSEQQVADVLEGFVKLQVLLKLDAIANPNETPEKIVETLMADMPCPVGVQQVGHDAIYRVALHSIVQVLMLVGPVMAEWQRLSFSSTFELPRRVVNRLNQISEQLDALGRSGQAAADERYELSYRDYLLQRFHRVEAGTVRMTTNMDVDLRELFVMPYILPRPLREKTDDVEPTDATALMDLAAARRFFRDESIRSEPHESAQKAEEGITALDQVKSYPRNVIVGIPGSGKSTFLEWLQVKLAAVEEELVIAGQQAIPLLLRVRQLDPRGLPLGAGLIEKATASKDRTALMPDGWIDRQMENGRVLLMLDGLDEVEPELRDRYVLPWLLNLCRQYPHCRYLVSSRPVGYAPGALQLLEFVECDLLDFGEPEIFEYSRHWCTAVRLARNEPEEEARREGTVDGGRIVNGFKDHPYIRNLARNPLMLSAICLVNYFEGGELPKDRVVLYRLCVEGLLHHWDQRRGIHSEFALDEKLRICREVAIVMQSDDRAEYEAEKVQGIIAEILDDPLRVEKLLEHIRYRTGLLLERRPGIFAFAHLTFQEYLAAQAVHEGNRLGIDVQRLVAENSDGRWNEVIALYCGIAPTPRARDMIERLHGQPDADSLALVLAEAYQAAGPELSQDHHLRRMVLGRIAILPRLSTGGVLNKFEPLNRFPPNEVAPIANESVGRLKIGTKGLSESWFWLGFHPELVDTAHLSQRLREWRTMNPWQITELVFLLHWLGPDSVLTEIASDADLYSAPGPFDVTAQAEVAMVGFSIREFGKAASSDGRDLTLLQILRTLSRAGSISTESTFLTSVSRGLEKCIQTPLPGNSKSWPDFAELSRRVAARLANDATASPDREPAITALNSWADMIQRAIDAKAKQ